MRNPDRPADPIVEEVRAAREAFARECDYDLDNMVKRLQAEQAASTRKIVSPPPRRLKLARKAS